MSSTISASSSFRKSFVKKSLVNTKRPQRSPVGYLFTPTPKGIHRELKSSQQMLLLTILIELRAKGITAPSLRLLASEMDLGVRQTQRHVEGLEAKGRLKRRRRFNNSSVFELIGFSGERNVINVRKKKGDKYLTTNTKTPATPPPASTPVNPPQSPPAPSKARLEAEARWAWDRECKRQMLAQRQARFELDRECTKWRKRNYDEVGKAIERRHRCGGSQHVAEVANFDNLDENKELMKMIEMLEGCGKDASDLRALLIEVPR